MDRGYALVEQLDLAAEQLAVATPVAARFALILCDNAVELLLHQSCVTEVEWDRYTSRVLPPKYSEATRRAVTGQQFDQKVRFCGKLGIVNPVEVESILSIHGYRNELYHVGVRHDGIIQPLAWLYFEIACATLPRQRVSMWRVIAPESDRVARHVDEADGFGDAVWENAAASLMALRPPLPKPFGVMLSEFAVEELENCGSGLDFLVADNPNGMDEAQMLEHLQFRHYCFEDGPRPRIDTSRISTVRELQSEMDRLRAGWTPPYQRSPIDRWLRRGAALTGETDPHVALKKFQQLQAESAGFRELVQEAASELDAYIQMEIDRLRGK